MKTSTQLFSRLEGDVEHAVLAAENLYTVTYEGRQICLKQDMPHRTAPAYKFLIYSNPNIAAKKMRELNQQYETRGFRVERVSNIEEIQRERGDNNLSTGCVTYVRTEKGWIEQ